MKKINSLLLLYCSKKGISLFSIKKLIYSFGDRYDERILDVVQQIYQIDNNNIYGLFADNFVNKKDFVYLLRRQDALLAHKFILSHISEHYVGTYNLAQIKTIIRYIINLDISDNEKYNYLETILTKYPNAADVLANFDSAYEELFFLLSLNIDNEQRFNLINNFIHSYVKFNKALDSAKLISLLSTFEPNVNKIIDALNVSFVYGTGFNAQELIIFVNHLQNVYSLNDSSIFKIISIWMSFWIKNLKDRNLQDDFSGNLFYYIINLKNDIKLKQKLLDFFVNQIIENGTQSFHPNLVYQIIGTDFYDDNQKKNIINNINRFIIYQIDIINCLLFVNSSNYKYKQDLIGWILTNSVYIERYDEAFKLFSCIKILDFSVKDKDNLYLHLITNATKTNLTSLFGYVSLYSFIESDIMRFKYLLGLFVVNRKDLFFVLEKFCLLYQLKEISAQDLLLAIDVMRKFLQFSVDPVMVPQVKKELDDVVKNLNLPQYSKRVLSSFSKEIKWLRGKEITPENQAKDALLDEITVSNEYKYSETAKTSDAIIDDAKKYRQILLSGLLLICLNLGISLQFFLQTIFYQTLPITIFKCIFLTGTILNLVLINTQAGKFKFESLIYFGGLNALLWLLKINRLIYINIFLGLFIIGTLLCYRQFSFITKNVNRTRFKTKRLVLLFAVIFSAFLTIPVEVISYRSLLEKTIEINSQEEAKYIFTFPEGKFKLNTDIKLDISSKFTFKGLLDGNNHTIEIGNYPFDKMKITKDRPRNNLFNNHGTIKNATINYFIDHPYYNTAYDFDFTLITTNDGELLNLKINASYLFEASLSNGAIIGRKNIVGINNGIIKNVEFDVYEVFLDVWRERDYGYILIDENNNTITECKVKRISDIKLITNFDYYIFVGTNRGTISNIEIISDSTLKEFDKYYTPRFYRRLMRKNSGNINNIAIYSNQDMFYLTVDDNITKDILHHFPDKNETFYFHNDLGNRLTGEAWKEFIDNWDEDIWIFEEGNLPRLKYFVEREKSNQSNSGNNG